MTPRRKSRFPKLSITATLGIFDIFPSRRTIKHTPQVYIVAGSFPGVSDVSASSPNSTRIDFYPRKSGSNSPLFVSSVRKSVSFFHLQNGGGVEEQLGLYADRGSLKGEKPTTRGTSNSMFPTYLSVSSCEVYDCVFVRLRVKETIKSNVRSISKCPPTRPDVLSAVACY